MIISKGIVKKIFDFVNAVKTENYYRFEKNDSGTLSVYGTDSYSYFRIDTGVVWDLNNYDFFSINLPNLSFIDSDIRIDIDNDYVYLFYGTNVPESCIKLLQTTENDFQPAYSFNVENIIDLSVDYEHYKLYFKTLLKHTNSGADDFTSCIYADSDTLFSTDKISSCWFLTEQPLFNDKILIDTKFINLFLRLDNFTSFKLIHNTTKIGFIVYYEEQNLSISYLTSTMFLNYPDFKTLFSKFDYINSISLSSKKMTELLTNIIKFDSKCDRVSLTIDTNLSTITVKEKSLDNSKFIELYANIEEYSNQFEGDYTFNINPHLLLKSIQDIDNFIIWFSYTKIQPILITNDDVSFRKYIQVYHA